MAHRNLLRNIAVLLLLLQAPLQAQEKGTFTHTIQRGETVYSIARTYQVSPDAILRLNPSANDGIKAGSTLVIPQQAQGTQKENFHTIQAGETLYQLTQKYGVDAETICQANPGLTADNFKAGMVIRIPGATARAITAPTPAASFGPSRTPAASTGMYTIVMDSGSMWMYPKKEKDMNSSAATTAASR